MRGSRNYHVVPTLLKIGVSVSVTDTDTCDYLITNLFIFFQIMKSDSVSCVRASDIIVTKQTHEHVYAK